MSKVLQQVTKLILATDIYYHNDNSATAAGILFPTWKATEASRSILKKLTTVEAYEPGAFYKRELPCILSLYYEVAQTIKAIVIDGYVTLGSDQRPGLGTHLFERIGKQVPVIGVAKTNFAGTPDECKIFRGKSRNPLYITSVGLSLFEAKAAIMQMYGEHRIPTLLKIVDQLSRGI